MRSRLLRSLGLCLAAIAIFGVGTSYADSVVITGGVTSVTNTSATLNGAINAGVQNVGWTFQYWNSLPPLRETGVVASGHGLIAVSKTISGLSPDTAYHFRLAGVAQVDPTQGPSFYTGDEFAFKTTNFGRIKLVHRRLKVKDGVVSMPFQCVGAKGLSCQGKVSLSTTEKVGHALRTLSCGRAKLAGPGGSTQTAHAKVGSRCAALLSASHQRSISANLNASFGAQQGALNLGVTLFG